MSTTALAALKLTNARKLRALPDVIKRRNKLLNKLGEQRALAVAQAEGTHYSPTRLRTFKHADSGERIVKQVTVRIKPWFWSNERGEVLLAVNYGSKQIELGKGKTAVEVGDAKNLIGVIDVLIAAVKAGELDAQIEAASGRLREGFKR